MDFPADLYYTREHEWARLEDDVATIGITDYAQGELGDIVFVELPQEGDSVLTGDAFGTIEAVKAVSELKAKFCMFTCTIARCDQTIPVAARRHWPLRKPVQVRTPVDRGDSLGHTTRRKADPTTKRPQTQT